MTLRKINWKETLERAVWPAGLERGYGPVVGQSGELINFSTVVLNATLREYKYRVAPKNVYTLYSSISLE